MKKSYQIAFVILFLIIIAVVPVVQTVHEYGATEGHRIQILDLVEDIVITPAKKAATDAALIDSVVQSTDLLVREVNAGLSDPEAGHFEKAAGYCDESIIRIRMLRQSVVDFNRHIAGPKNRFAANDTLKPYYRALAELHGDLDTLLMEINGARDSQVLNARASGCLSEVNAIKTAAKRSKGIAAYCGLTLSAMSRIMVGADYLRPYEKEMEKSSVFAQTVRPWLLYGYYRALNDMGSKGIMGRHEWFFYKSDVDYLVKPYVTDVKSKIVDPTDVAITDTIVGAIVAFKNQLAARGIDLLFVPMPTKPSVYPDLLNRRMRPEQSGTISHSRRMMEELNRAGVETIDLFTAFAQERKNDQSAGDSLYLRTDTHFKGRGVLVMARAIADRVRRYPWYSPGGHAYRADPVTVVRIGDIGEMTQFSRDIMDRHRPPFQPESTVCHQVWDLVQDESGVTTDSALYKDDFRNSPVLVLGDSYSRIYQTDQPRSAGWIAHLAKELKQPVASIVNDGGASTLVRETLARKPGVLKGKKLVIWEVVERDFRFGEEGWKYIPF